MHVSIHDPRLVLEAAHAKAAAGEFHAALELAQEAAGLYQRVTDTPAHPGVVRCLELIANTLLEAGEYKQAANQQTKALGLLVQIGGFDCAEGLNLHMALIHMLSQAGEPDRAVKHLRAVIYLISVMAGPRFEELTSYYFKLGSVYQAIQEPLTALKFLKQASKRDSCDRLLRGMLSRNTAMIFAGLEKYKAAVEAEKRAYKIFKQVLGENHQMVQQSDATLRKFLELSVQQGKGLKESEKKRKEEAEADAMASLIVAAEAEEAKSKKKKKRKSRKKKKKKGK